MTVIVNQATPETISLWNVRNIHIIREDTVMRHKIAIGNFDFIGVGLCPFFLDVLKTLISCFKKEHEEFLPNEGEVWVKPFLEKMKAFPQNLLRSWQYKFLGLITAGIIFIAFLIGAFSAWKFIESNMAGKEVEISREIVMPQEKASEISQIKIPQEFKNRVWLKDNQIHFKGPILPIERDQLKALSKSLAFRDAVVEGVLIVNEKVVEAANKYKKIRHFSLLGFLSVIIILAVRTYFHLHLRQHKKFLKRVISTLDSAEHVKHVQLMKQLLSEESGKSQLAWLKEQFFGEHPELRSWI
jgi:hypothetical protein